jgi:hypothetical protein
VYLLVGTLLVVPLSPAGAQEVNDNTETQSADPAEINNSEDITRPVTRFDIRLGWTRTATGRSSIPVTLRQDRSYDLGESWKLGLRLDVPLVVNNVPSKTIIRKGLLFREFTHRSSMGPVDLYPYRET